MADFDYGNARIRAMKSRLLPRRLLEGYSELATFQGLLTELINTPYREVVEAALVGHEADAVLEEAQRNDLAQTARKVRSFYSDDSGKLVALLLQRYDLYNLKALVRGLTRRIAPEDILAGMLPAGELGPADLMQLARAASLREALDLLATWALPAAKPILLLRAQRRADELGAGELEIVLDRWYFDAAVKAGREAEEEGRLLAEAVRLEADTANILVALRLVGLPDAGADLRARLGAQDATPLFVGPGHVRIEELVAVSRRETVAAAVGELAGSAYGPALMAALPDFGATNRLSVFQRALSVFTLRQMSAMLVRDPLGIGVPIGYMALKTNEVANLRTLAQGIAMGEKADRIRSELTWAA